MEIGYFPDPWKIARVSPIFKQGDPTDLGNYRPISVLPVFSKIFERIIQKRILSFLNKQGSILGTQYGFRRNHSTFMAVMDMVEHVRCSWQKNEHCLGIFIDYRKAFDTVNHDILISKLEHIGIRGLPLDLIKSYLNSRHQYVAFRRAESTQREVEVGVPQGSILGPLFFLVYINDISRASSLLRNILFADDSNQFISDSTRAGLYRKTNLELAKVASWVAHNKLTLNYDKTEFIEFSRNKLLSKDNFTLLINGKPIRRVDECKFLGVYIDSSISWRSHINKIISRISQTIGIIGRAKSFMNSTQLGLLYNTMVLPHLQYCIINWGNFKHDKNIALKNKLLSLQKSLVRIIGNAHRISHTDPLFFNNSILKIDDLFEQSIRVFSFKINNNLLPREISSFIDTNKHSYNTRGARNNLFVTLSDKRSIKSLVPACWNALPLPLKQCPSVASFKTSSKNDLLAHYKSFCCHTRNCQSCLV